MFFTLGLYKKKSESVGEFFGHCEPGNLKQRQDYPVLLAKAFLSGARQPEVDFLHS